jgi:hypothetical protein
MSCFWNAGSCLLGVYLKEIFMKALFLTLSLLTLTSTRAFSSPDFCPSQCEPPRPTEYSCKIEMVDCNNHSLYVYTGYSYSHKDACRLATRRCMNEVSAGYGGWGAKCWMIGKSQDGI